MNTTVANNGCTDQGMYDNGISTNGDSEGFQAPPYAVDRIIWRQHRRGDENPAFVQRSVGAFLPFANSRVPRVRVCLADIPSVLCPSAFFQVYPMSG